MVPSYCTVSRPWCAYSAIAITLLLLGLMFYFFSYNKLKGINKNIILVLVLRAARMMLLNRLNTKA